MKAWYLVYCKSKNEERAKLNLMMQGVESYFPMFMEDKLIKGKKVTKRVPLFPNYLFVYFDPAQFSVSRLHSTRGVSRIVGCGEVIQPIDSNIIKVIKSRELESKELVVTDISQGSKVRVVDGPFIELDGVYEQSCGKERCQILLTIMGKTQNVTLPLSSIQAI